MNKHQGRGQGIALFYTSNSEGIRGGKKCISCFIGCSCAPSCVLLLLCTYLQLKEATQQWGYSKMWEVIIESVCTLQIQHQVPVMSQVLMGDFNAHIGTNKAGTIPDHILVEHRNANY